jgi:hypothetical protein
MVTEQADDQSSLGDRSAFGLYMAVSSGGIGQALRLGISTVDSLAMCDTDTIGTNGPGISQGGFRHPWSDGAGDIGSRDRSQRCGEREQPEGQPYHRGHRNRFCVFGERSYPEIKTWNRRAAGRLNQIIQTCNWAIKKSTVMQFSLFQITSQRVLPRAESTLIALP